MRDADLDRRFDAPPSATSHNVNSFLFCLSLYLRKVIEPIEEQMTQLECFWKFSKFLTWVFRHSAQLLHEDLSLTLNELFWFQGFNGHINSGLSYIQHISIQPTDHFLETLIVRASEKNVVSIRYLLNRCAILFLLFALFGSTTKEGLLYQFNTNLRRAGQRPEEWKTPPLNELEMLDHIRHNGVIRGTNIFFRAQSGHSRIRQTQRPGVDYDFRHNILIHKTTANNFIGIKHRDNKAVKYMGREHTLCAC